MEERIERTLRHVEGGARRAADAAEASAARAGTYLQGRLEDVTGRASDIVRDANDQVERLTGRSLDEWSEDLRRYVRTHPLHAVAITIGVGYLLGKLMQRG
jgi:ElaB/YqjD/DUF883 family membrane-anchored ribosome-binding protein